MVHYENATDGRILCTEDSASGGRTKGPVLALYFWMRYAALHAFRTARFFGKADDDTWIHLPDVEAHLLAIPPGDAAKDAYCTPRIQPFLSPHCRRACVCVCVRACVGFFMRRRVRLSPRA